MTRPNRVTLMSNIRSNTWTFVALAAAGMFAFAPSKFASVANAQEINQSLSSQTDITSADITTAAQMLLESDDIIYDNDQQLVIATGNVQIAYDGYSLVAAKVSYDRKSGRVIASGSVEILEPNGNRIYADEIDLTDDFSEGFVAALNVETTEETRISAESAVRRNGEFTTFNNAVYTACKACKDNPEKPPLWQIRAKKVTINNATRAVEYEDATFEVFGVPVLRMPRFAHADPSIKRKSGFLIPTFSSHSELGAGVRNAYFFNLAPNFDLTIAGRYYTRQGFMAETEWRHRTEHGQYNITFAGIDQQDRSAFSSTVIDSEKERRLAITTAGKFDINPRWQFGWNALFQSDTNFARTYGVKGFSDNDVTNEVYLRGLAGKNYFNLAAQDFLVQNSSVADFDSFKAGRQTLQDQQATVAPILDYNRVSDEDNRLGQFSLDVNIASLRRGASQVINSGGGTTERFHGIRGNYTRASINLDWKNSLITESGALVTVALGGRGDGIQVDSEGLGTVANPLTSNQSIYRFMPNAMLEIRYPMVASTTMATHIFEPIAQVVTRPNERYVGLFPNEDAQSLVFDTSNLFDTNKFSGYDRVEGGTRANIGFRYSATFETGSSIDIVAGQSFHLAGKNSFAKRDLVNAGMESGLETKRSDYVASIAYDTNEGITFGASGRFDERNFALRRAEVGARYISPIISANTSYIFTDAQPNYGLAADRHEVNASGSIRFAENWRAFGNASYDIQNSAMISDGIGLAYDDECYSFSVSYNNSRERTGQVVAKTIGFKFGLRTIGGYGYKHKLGESIF